MAGTGRISLLIDSPLRAMLLAVRTVPAELRKQITEQTKKAAQPIWAGELKERAATRMQQRVLVDTAKVGVTARNTFLRSATTGKLSSGTRAYVLAAGAEFGMGPGKQIKTHSRKGTAYTRRAGAAFPSPRRGGHVVYPAARDSIPRFASLWIQTAIRTLLDAFDGKDK